MTTPHVSVLDAWIDEEDVSRDDVLRALASVEGQRYVVDAMRLRRLYRGDAGLVPLDVAAAVPAPPSSRGWLMGAAAAAIVLAGATGFLAGASTRTPDTPPVTAAAPLPDAAPQPTRVISLTPGVNWHEASGGN